MIRKPILVTALVLSISSIAQADGRYGWNTAPHAGQVDTDGILSRGEIRNPGINYNLAQRFGEWRGDQRYDNPYNDEAAARDRSRGQYLPGYHRYPDRIHWEGNHHNDCDHDRHYSHPEYRRSRWW